YGVDEINGSKGNDVLNGGNGGDKIHGGEGNDVLISGDGGNYNGVHISDKDSMHGGPGIDTFVKTDIHNYNDAFDTVIINDIEDNEVLILAGVTDINEVVIEERGFGSFTVVNGDYVAFVTGPNYKDSSATVSVNKDGYVQITYDFTNP
ncbi:MAG: hypothetical protein GY754_33150, partial [bacterium]|nr:hypothetical protein [bacterium]